MALCINDAPEIDWGIERVETNSAELLTLRASGAPTWEVAASVVLRSRSA